MLLNGVNLHKSIFIFFFCIVYLNGKNTDKITLHHPWFTGSILTPSANIVAKNQFKIKPHIYNNSSICYLNNYWHINRYADAKSNVNLQLLTHISMSDYMDMIITPQFFFNHEGSVNSLRVGDFTIGLEFQLLKEKINTLTSAIKFNISETLPIGSYQYLSVKNIGTDASGGGSFSTNFGITLNKIWNINNINYLSLTTNLNCNLFTPVNVHYINVYGGDFTTKGIVYPGSVFNILASVEYNLTKNWAIALDGVNTIALKTKFIGTTIAPVGNKNLSYILSFAPAIEYNYSANIGIIGGIWFYATGINAFDFLNAVIAVNWSIPHSAHAH